MLCYIVYRSGLMHKAKCNYIISEYLPVKVALACRLGILEPGHEVPHEDVLDKMLIERLNLLVNGVYGIGESLEVSYNSATDKFALSDNLVNRDAAKAFFSVSIKGAQPTEVEQELFDMLMSYRIEQLNGNIFIAMLSILQRKAFASWIDRIIPALCIIAIVFSIIAKAP